jgi:hypothetical protein
MDTPLTDEQKKFTQQIKTSSESLLVLINDILDLTKIEAGAYYLPTYLPTYLLPTYLSNNAEVYAYILVRSLQHNKRTHIHARRQTRAGDGGLRPADGAGGRGRLGGGPRHGQGAGDLLLPRPRGADAHHGRPRPPAPDLPQPLLERHQVHGLGAGVRGGGGGEAAEPERGGRREPADCIRCLSCSFGPFPGWGWGGRCTWWWRWRR